MTPELFLELAWKSGLVAGAALVAAALMRRRPAAERVLVLRLGLGLVLALPLLMALLPAMQVVAWPATVVEAPPVVSTAMGLQASAPATPATLDPSPNAAGAGFNVWTVVLGLYGLGVLALMLRLAAGVLTLRRWTRQAETVSDPAWLAALERATRGRGGRLVLAVSARVPSPLSWSWRPPVILLSPDVLARPDQAAAVLGHEMGHVRRGDWLFLMLSRGLVAVFWFNPLIWLLQRELSRQSEQAADAYAVRGMARVAYADALMALARRDLPHAALGMSGTRGDLARRVTAILAPSPRGVGSWVTGLCVAGCIGVATPLAALELCAATPAGDDRPAGASQSVPPIVSEEGIDRPAPAARERLGPSVRGQAAASADQTRDPQAETRAQVQQAERLREEARAQVELGSRQRREGVAQMRAGLASMEQAIVSLRHAAEDPRVTAEDRIELRADAEDLERDARQLRGEAEALELEITTDGGSGRFLVRTDVSTGVKIQADGIDSIGGQEPKFKLKGDARIEADELEYGPAQAGSPTSPEPVPIPRPRPAPSPAPRPAPNP